MAANSISAPRTRSSPRSAAPPPSRHPRPARNSALSDGHRPAPALRSLLPLRPLRPGSTLYQVSRPPEAPPRASQGASVIAALSCPGLPIGLDLAVHRSLPSAAVIRSFPASYPLLHFTLQWASLKLRCELENNPLVRLLANSRNQIFGSSVNLENPDDKRNRQIRDAPPSALRGRYCCKWAAGVVAAEGDRIASRRPIASERIPRKGKEIHGWCAGRVPNRC